MDISKKKSQVNRKIYSFYNTLHKFITLYTILQHLTFRFPIWPDRFHSCCLTGQFWEKIWKAKIRWWEAAEF
jgi:hypothetical protein